MDARTHSQTNLTPKGFLDIEWSSSVRRMQDTEIGSKHETFDTEEGKAMTIREEGGIIVFDANGPLLGVGEGKLATGPELNRLLQPRAVASYESMIKLAGIPCRFGSGFLDSKEVELCTMRLLAEETDAAAGPVRNLHTAIPRGKDVGGPDAQGE
jgi:hypothetical protein